MIKPSNLPDVVEEFISLLELDADQLFSLEQNDPGKWNATWLLYSTDGSYIHTYIHIFIDTPQWGFSVTIGCKNYK